MIRALGCTLMAALALTLFGAPQVSAQSVDFAGEWALTVRTDQGTSNPTLTLEQDGTELTGTYRSETLGEQEIRGTVDGSAIRISFSADMQGQSFPVSYRGTLGDDGVITGTLDIADGAFQGSFTATRAG